ncbi:MAG TPA: PAS domain S-box protein [Labilithrix sp.]
MSRSRIDSVHEGEELLRRILDAVPGGVVHVDRDGSIKNANPEALRILGFRFDALTKRYISDFDPETMLEDGSPCPVAEYPVARVLRTGKPAGPVTIGVRRPDGVLSWALFRAEPVLDAQGELAGAVVTFLDITARKVAEADLKRSEEKWRSLGEHLPAFVIVVDRDTNILSTNRLAPGYREEDVIGRTALAFIEEAHHTLWKEKFAAAIETSLPQSFETVGSASAAGKMAWYETNLVPLAEGEGVTRVLVVASDVTDRRAMLATLAEKERLASVGMLAASVAHEIMNPLTYVLANLDFALGAGGRDEERRARALADAREGAARMQQIVWDLRALGRGGTEELFYVDARAVIETALRLCGPAVEQAAKIETALGDVPSVLASESRLCQVVINLVVNAAQAVEVLGTGRGTIRVKTLQDDALGLVGIEIADDGEGIEAASLPRIFEPFYTTKRAGTGLGLSICRDIVAKMGGRIDVASAPGKGSTFTVWLSTTRTA